ncbi:MAG: DnaJ domain-containing protein [Polyangiaceae bacterium]|nr:DnaJ domain-containing protein [Polyangiaceae bacterium]
MKLPGRLDATTLGDLLGSLHRERATGILELVEWAGMSAGRAHRIHLGSGLVERVETPIRGLPLGEILRQEGFVDSEALRRMLRRLAESPLKRAGEILVEERLVTRAAVLAALRCQLRYRLDALFALRGVRLRFHVARAPFDQEDRIPLSPREFLHGRPRAREQAHPGRSDGQAPPSGRRPTIPVRTRALAVLGLDSAAAPDAVRTAFRRLAREVHPDRHPTATDPERAELMRRFAELSAAYHALVA